MSTPHAAGTAADFDFELPPELIAQHPAPHRTDARLLHVPPGGDVVHRRFTDLPTLLRAGDLLVLNETRVIPARLRMRRESGGAVEVLLAGARPDGSWRAFLKPSRRLRVGESLYGAGDAFEVRVVALGEEPAVEFVGGSADAIVQQYGEIPLPPYIHREPTPEDTERYQTVYARCPGAVAAPTAGLHFDEATFDSLRATGVDIARLVLHVGPGTFRPLPDDFDLETVQLDAERYDVPAAVAAAVLRTRNAAGRVIAAGTTVVRSLESWAADGAPPGGSSGETRLFIRPPHAFRVVDALVTNFHLPRSSLLCLVAALVGRRRILDAYAEAVRERYRFYSYGDATFLEPPEPRR